jgi:hypothetical protein
MQLKIGAWFVPVKKVFESMFLAWIWLFLFILHFLFLSDAEPTNKFLIIFDKIMFFSCFLIYPYAMPFYATETFWPFFMQFVFWWIFGFVMLKVYQRFDDHGPA